METPTTGTGATIIGNVANTKEAVKAKPPVTFLVSGTTKDTIDEYIKNPEIAKEDKIAELKRYITETSQSLPWDIYETLVYGGTALLSPGMAYEALNSATELSEKAAGLSIGLLAGFGLLSFAFAFFKTINNIQAKPYAADKLKELEKV